MGRTWERMAGGGEEVSPRLLRLLSWGILCHSTNYTHGERRWEQIEGHFRAGHLETAALTPEQVPTPPHLLLEPSGLSPVRGMKVNKPDCPPSETEIMLPPHCKLPQMHMAVRRKDQARKVTR